MTKISTRTGAFINRGLSEIDPWSEEDDVSGNKMLRNIPVRRGNDVEWAPYQRLAQAVLARAVKDAEKGDEGAKHFLRPENEMFQFWKEVAGY